MRILPKTNPPYTIGNSNFRKSETVNPELDKKEHGFLLMQIGVVIRIICDMKYTELKDEIHDLMSKKPYLWKTRPLNEKLIYYAGCDVK